MNKTAKDNGSLPKSVVFDWDTDFPKSVFFYSNQEKGFSWSLAPI